MTSSGREFRKTKKKIIPRNEILLWNMTFSFDVKCLTQANFIRLACGKVLNISLWTFDVVQESQNIRTHFNCSNIKYDNWGCEYKKKIESTNWRHI